jgi:3-phenylpropionate/trans-cinnamate dioxygenase ferredoxin subunit
MEENIQYYPVVKSSELANGERLFLEVSGIPVVIFNLAGNFYAIGDVCTHDNGPLGDGELVGYEVVCPRHGARFDIRTGKATRLPAVKPAPTFPIRLNGEMIELGVPK